jgi:hypothetical protein
MVTWWTDFRGWWFMTRCYAGIWRIRRFSTLHGIITKKIINTVIETSQTTAVEMALCQITFCTLFLARLATDKCSLPSSLKIWLSVIPAQLLSQEQILWFSRRTAVCQTVLWKQCVELVTGNEDTLGCNISHLSLASHSLLSCTNGWKTVFLHNLTRLKRMFANDIITHVSFNQFPRKWNIKKAPINWPPTQQQAT